MASIILGDPHIGKNVALGKSPIGAGINSRIDDQFKLLDWVLDSAIDLFASSIIITGDVFEDPKPSIALITMFISWLKKCQVNNIDVHIIIGNHDILRSGSIYSNSLDLISVIELSNTFIYKQNTTIFIDNIAFTLMPFTDRKSLGSSLSNNEAISLLKNSLVYELSMIPTFYKKVLIGHLALENSIPIGDEIDDLCNELFCPLNMFTGYDYVWMGHVHKSQVMSKQPYIAHIGSMDISNFGETEQQKVIIFINNDGFQTKIIPTRILKKITINVPENVDTTEYVLTQLKQQKNISNSIIKLEVVLSKPELSSIDKSKLMQYLASNDVCNANISESKKIEVLKKNPELHSKMDVISAIKAYSNLHIKEKNRSDFIDLAIDMYKNLKV